MKFQNTFKNAQQLYTKLVKYDKNVTVTRILPILGSTEFFTIKGVLKINLLHGVKSVATYTWVAIVHLSLPRDRESRSFVVTLEKLGDILRLTRKINLGKLINGFALLI